MPKDIKDFLLADLPGGAGTGYTGSQGPIGYTGSGGSLGPIGYTGSAGGNSPRTDVVLATAVLADGSSESGSVSMAKSFLLLKITSDRAAWVRLYKNQAARTADQTRGIATDPTPGSGVICDLLFSGAETIDLAPIPLGGNTELAPTISIPYTVTNKSGGAAAVTLTLTYVRLE